MKQRPLHIFSRREAYLLIAASMFLGLFVSLSLQGMLAGMVNTALLDRLIVLIGELVILVPPLLILRQRQVKIRQVIPLKPISQVTFVMAVVMVIGVIGLVSIFEILVLPFFPIPEFLEQLEADLSNGILIDTLILIIAGSLAAPLVEEFLFRGILQHSLFYRFGSLLPAMAVPTVIFTLFHVAYLFYLPALIELVALALLLAWLMAKTGNLLIPILVHGLFNLSSFVGIFVTNLEENSSLSDLGWPWIVLAILFSGVGWFYFKSMRVVVFDEVYLIPPLNKKVL